MNVAGLQASIIRFALRFRGIIVVLACLLVAYGIYVLNHASYDAFPEFAPPQVDIQTEAPGFAAEQVETLVTRPIETEVNGIANLQRIESSSIQGLSDIKVYFGLNTDLYRDRQQVAERLATLANQLPVGVRAPGMIPMTSSGATILVIGITSERQSLMKLRTIAKWTIRPSLLSVPGVAGAEVFGGEEKSTQILVHPDRLIRYGLGMEDVLAAARRATGVGGAGFIGTPNQRITLETETEGITPDDIARTTVLRPDGGRIALGDVADVIEAPEPSIGAAAIMGEPGVVMNIDEQYGANTLQVTKAIEAALADLEPSLKAQGVVLHGGLFRPANFIVAATDNLRSSLLIGGVLVIVVLILFLFDLRAAAICCTAIPISLLAAVVVLQQSGITLNTMTLGGLAIALGEVVDDAVIGIENITRRLRENQLLPQPRPAARVVLEATFEVRSAVVYATFAVLLVFLPVVTLAGVAGRLFAPLGLTYIYAVLASLIVALTVTPALSLLLLPRHAKAHTPPVVKWTRGRYESVLHVIVGAPRLAIFFAALLTAGGLALLPLFGETFLPDLQEGHFIVHMTAMPGTSTAEGLRMGARIAQAMMNLPMVKTVAQRVGRVEQAAAGDTHGTHQSEFEVELNPISGHAAMNAKQALLAHLLDFPGVNISANTFLTERVNETFSGYSTPVAVNVYGSDLGVINDTAERVVAVLRGVPGASSVEIESPLGLPQVSIKLRSADLHSFGLDPASVLDVVRTAYQGDIVGQTYQADRVFDVVVRLAERRVGDVVGIGDLPLRAPDGTYVRLAQVADIAPTSGLYLIEHQGGRRLQSITLDVQGRDPASFVKDAKAALAAKIKLPPDTYLVFTGAAQGQAEAQQDLTLKSICAGVGIVLLLSIVTRNWRNLLVTLANLPFALVGGVVAVFFSGAVLSLGSLVGFVTLFGITLRNSMMMISHYEHLVSVDAQTWNKETAVRGAGDRLAAVLMTSLVTGLGLLPLAIGMNTPGREIEGPMALVILGGLFTSTALNLFILPPLSLRFGRFIAPTADELADASPPAKQPVPAE
ncbi:efflux RND transporter permease subunit [uncultured Methylovirgula sp.]|uniref:efflux RND transporter permease subunit n=1 Tax=uncultured Methylovirgula sp. TaxID=1285960 RepID=UPI00260EA928|nr:efflux RND transporter permease subunit [uncultured Methylovirgula sp.]